MKNVLFITVLFIVFASLAQAASYSDIVSQLPRLQDPSGAFKASGRSPVSLEATQDSLFLYSVYGLGRKIDISNIPSFLNSLRNSDGGYGSSVGAPSTLESTWRAVQSFAHLRVAVPDLQKTVAYIKSQADSNGLFVSAPGNSGDIISTYYAVDSLKLLIESSEQTAVKAVLKQVEEQNKFAFSTQLENLYAILVAHTVNYVISNPDDFARQIVSFQTPSGGFYEDLQNPVVTFRSTALSVQAINLLENQSGRTLSTFVSFDKIVGFVQTVPFDVTLAADAHRTLVFSPYYKNNFKLYTPFESSTPVKEGVVLLGSQFKATFAARAFGGVSHSAFTVSASITLPDDSTKDLAVSWDNDNQYYSTDFISASTLGPFSVTFNVVHFIPTVGEVSFDHVAEGAFGYSLAVTADATHELTGRKISQGDSISVGTTFNFNAILKDKNSKAVTSGDFEIAFIVLDSSNLPIHSASLSGVDNKAAFQFQYTLTENNLPPGHLSFYFELQNLNNKAFVSQKLQYLISTPLVSTSLSVEQEYQLGDNVEVSFVPAVFPDHRTLININPAKRVFFLDITTSSGKVLNTVRGISSDSSVSFSFNIEPSFDSLGTSVLSFRYVTAEGLSVALGNYDSFAEELLEDSPSFTVNSELQIVEISEQPGSNDFFYGNDITFRYAIEDQLSGKRITQGKSGHSYLAVNHFDERSGKHFTSTKVIATQEGNELVVSWEINPNAVEGKGTLVLGAVDASGSEVELVEAKSQKAIALDVTIGGEIKETKEIFDLTDFYTSKSSFVLEFGLTCHHKALRNAKLRASVLRKNGGKYEEIASVPVAISGDSYSVSYAAKHKEFPSGEYKVQVFREIDQTRADEAQDQRQKLVRQKQREAELNGEQFNEQEFLASLEVETELKPILETTFSHKEVSKGGLFIRTEWLVLIPLVAGFLYFDGKKRSYNTQNSKF